MSGLWFWRSLLVCDLYHISVMAFIYRKKKTRPSIFNEIVNLATITSNRHFLLIFFKLFISYVDLFIFTKIFPSFYTI